MDDYKAAFGEEAEKSMLDVAAIGMELALAALGAEVDAEFDADIEHAI
jgi:hypothetical protein